MTPKAQRIGILVIVVVMVVGTLGSFAMMMLATDNTNSEQEQLAREYQETIEKEQREAAELSSKYYSTFKQYESRPAAFDAKNVGEKVTYVDLKEGDGETITEGFNNYKAYYIVWKPEGEAFDGSIKGDQLSSPIDMSENTLIPGWYDGVKGMKIGGVREITIPSDLAYGETGSNAVAPNTPIKFIIMAIPADE